MSFYKFILFILCINKYIHIKNIFHFLYTTLCFIDILSNYYFLKSRDIDNNLPPTCKLVKFYNVF